MKNLLSKIIILSAFIALFISCSSSDSATPTPVDTKPTISSFSPQSAGLGSTITITGTNFSTTAANNVVTINGVTATVTAATATQLSVTVPACSGTGDVKVTVGSTTATAASQFTFVSPPTITSIWPLSGGYGSTVVITGTNFSTTAANNKVTINGVDATVTAATATQLTVTVPACGGNGTVNVALGSAIITGPTFTYIPDVFAVGYDGKYAMLWKNGIATALTDGTHNAEATSVFVVGGDVYVAGFQTGLFNVAKVWKNGTATALTDGSKVAQATSLYVVGNDVYVAGFEDTGNHSVAKVWKNGVATALTDGSKGAEATSLYVVGNDLYVGGWEGTPYANVAKVWKNGVVMNLGTTDAVVRSLYVVGSDLYAAGAKNGIPTVWKNGNATTLANSGYINSIYVSGTDVYVAGTDGNRAKVWKNGVATALTDGTKYANGNSVFLYGSDVYVGGNEDPFTIGNNPTYKAIAKVWKNGVATNLTNGSDSAIVLSIVVR